MTEQAAQGAGNRATAHSALADTCSPTSTPGLLPRNRKSTGALLSSTMPSAFASCRDAVGPEDRRSAQDRDDVRCDRAAGHPVDDRLISEGEQPRPQSSAQAGLPCTERRRSLWDQRVKHAEVAAVVR